MPDAAWSQRGECRRHARSSTKLWIDANGIREWMCPGDVISVGAVLDVRVGGSFRIVMESKEREHVHIGTYQVVELASKLVFTWAAAGDSKENDAGDG
jgi:uncharacterized protein YndB with AHSA1/START domain